MAWLRLRRFGLKAAALGLGVLLWITEIGRAHV